MTEPSIGTSLVRVRSLAGAMTAATWNKLVSSLTGVGARVSVAETERTLLVRKDGSLIQLMPSVELMTCEVIHSAIASVMTRVRKPSFSLPFIRPSPYVPSL